jgi:hypothetical protein
VAKTGTLTFAPGETTKTITIEAKSDKKKELNDRFYHRGGGSCGTEIISKKQPSSGLSACRAATATA